MLFMEIFEIFFLKSFYWNLFLEIFDLLAIESFDLSSPGADPENFGGEMRF